jgi:hypothetical protein
VRKRRPYRLPATAQRSPSTSRATAKRVPISSDVLTIDNVSRLLVGLSLGLYILGLLSVNAYLLSLGVSDFTLVRVRFIYTGAFIMSFATTSLVIPVTFFFLMSWWYGLIRSKTLDVRIWHYVAITMVSLMGFLLTPALFASILDFVDADSRALSGFQPAFNQYILALALGLGYLVVLRGLVKASWLASMLPTLPGAARLRRNLAWTSPPLARISFRAYAVFSLIILSAIYVFFFMKNIYPLVPVQFGGGRPSTVQLLFDHGAVAGAKELGVPFSSQSDVSAPVQLAYEGSNSYVIRLPQGTIVQLDKDIVTATLSKEFTTVGSI